MDKRVKNVIIVDDTADNFGGTAQIAYITAVVLRDRGYNVVYFAGCGPIHSRLDGFKVVVANEQPFLESDNKVAGALSGLHSKKSYERFCALLNQFNPDDTVVHVHSWTHALSSSIFDAIADSGFKVLVTFHEYFLVCPNGGFYDYKKHRICHLKACSAKCIRCNCDKRSYVQKLYRVVRIALQNRSIKRAHPKFCYLSDFTYDIMRGSEFDDGMPCILPNPISVEGELSLGVPSEKNGYLFVGRFDKEKNPELFCRALTSLGLPGTLCGSGPEFERLRDAYPNLNFLGWCDKDVLADQFKSNKALVMTSSWYEASPLVCLEAMFASGIPSIVPETCGAIAYIRDGVNGLLFKNGDVSSLCEAISKLEDSNYYEMLCESTRRLLPSLQEDRSYETYANRVSNLYEGLYV